MGCSGRLINGPTAIRTTATHVHSAHIAEEDSGDVLSQLEAVDTSRLAEIARRCAASCSRDGYAATPRPWPAVLVLVDDKGREAVLQLVASVLRFDGDSPYEPSLDGIGEGPAIPVWDCTLDEDEEVWLWDLMARHLGPTQEKAYRTGADRTGAGH